MVTVMGKPNERDEHTAARDDQQVVRDYIVSLAPHRTSDVEEAVALTALGNLTPKRDDAPAKLAAVEALHYRTTYKLENGVDPVDVVDGCVICGPNWPCNTRRVIA